MATKAANSAPEPTQAIRNLTIIRAMRITACILAFTLPIAFGQTPPAEPRFEVASLKLVPGKPGETQLFSFSVTDTRVQYVNAPLKLLISIAYGTGESRMVTKPGWSDSERYTVQANLPAQAKKEQAPAMLQALLAERLKLVVHWEPKETTIYDLVIAKGGSKLQPAEPGVNGPNYIVKGHYMGAAVPLSLLAENLTNMTGRPVVDATGLTGVYKVDFRWAPDETNAEAAAKSSDPSLYTALQEKLGLTLRSRKGSIQVLVIDSVARVPAEN